MATKMYCCKKWVNGRVQKFMSYVPCSGGAVPCHEADPSGDTQGDGLNRYWGDDRDDQFRNGDRTQDEEERRKFLPIYEDIESPSITDDTGGESPCEGGIPLTREFVGGKGKGAAIWKDPYGKIPAKYYRSSDWEGHQVWDPETKRYYRVEALYDYYEGKTDVFPSGKHKVCPKGMKRRKNWCCPDVDAGAGAGQDGTTLGWYDWPDEIKALLSRMGERSNFLLDYPRGITDQEKNAIINYATTNLQRGERGDIRSLEETMSRAGLAGAGPQFEEAEKIRRGYREAGSGLQQGLAIDDASRRFQELTTTTAMSANLLQLLMGGETTLEGINVGRRGEGRMDIGMLLQYLGILTGGQDNSYWQALINQMSNNQGGGSSMMDWLPWLGYIAGGKM